MFRNCCSMENWSSLLISLVCLVLFVVYGRRSGLVGALLLAAGTGAAFLALKGDFGITEAKMAVRVSDGGDSGGESSFMPAGGGVETMMPPRVPSEEPHGRFTGSAACRECHGGEFESWHDSYHRTMTQKVSPQVVIGDFRHQRLTNHARSEVVELGRSGDLFTYARVDSESDRAMGHVPLTLATGSHHMQAYWYPAAVGDSLGMMPFVYLREDERWIPREAAFVVAPDASMGHEVGRWNEVCFRCHTTGGESHRVDTTSLHETRVAEYGISCEACHGPGGAHVAFQRVRKENVNAPGEDPIKNPATLAPKQSLEACGSCHRAVVFETQPPSSQSGNEVKRHLMDRDDPAYQEFLEEAARDGAREGAKFRSQLNLSFWADGMVRISGRECDGIEQSACHLRGGVTCVDCHSMHRERSDRRATTEWADDQLRLDGREDASCTKCHEAAQYASSDHTHHGVESSGSRCMNCHMPHTSFGLLKASRSHWISSPSATETVKFRRQNACNICHLDKTLGWTAERLAGWYGIEEPELTAEQRNYSSVALTALKGDGVDRALAAWHLGWDPAVRATGGDWAAGVLATLMEDDYTAIRYVAGGALKRWPGYGDLKFDFIAPEEQRKGEVAAVRRFWEGRLNASSGGASVFISDQGGYQAAEVERLLRKRDNRPVYLPE